jgi:regulator of sigma E protease
MLGVMNLLPIPARWRSCYVFLLYEIISGKTKWQVPWKQMVGFVLLITLLLFANGNDIYKQL